MAELRQDGSEVPIRLPSPGPSLWLRSFATLRRRGSAGEDLESNYLISTPDLAGAADYARQLGFAGDPLPLSFLYLPAQRAHLALMLDRRFPYPLVGMVHAGERWLRHAPIDCAAPLALRVSLQHEPPSRSGACFVSLQSRFEQGGVLCAEAHSSYLARSGQKPPKVASKPPLAEEPTLPWIASYRLDGDAGRRYARLSGDFNPIHLWPWSARLFGFRRPIIHGMHSLGRCLALLQAHHGRRAGSIEVRFQSPVSLPGEVSLHGQDEHFELRTNGKVALRGRVGFAGARE